MLHEIGLDENSHWKDEKKEDTNIESKNMRHEIAVYCGYFYQNGDIGRYYPNMKRPSEYICLISH